MAKAAANYTQKQIPRFVYLSCVLDCLHTNDVAALTRAASFRHYDPEFLDSCLEHLDAIGARVRGNVDRGAEGWIELMDYCIGFMRATVPARGWVHIAQLESRYAYPASEVKDRSSPVHRPQVAEPYYRRIVDNVCVETGPLLRVMGRTWWARQVERQLCLPSPSRLRSERIERALRRRSDLAIPRVIQMPPVVELTAQPQELKRIDPFRTGASGRSTPAHIVRAEAERRISSGEVKPKRGDLGRFAATLAKWWGQERQKYEPPGPPMTAGSIENVIRELWSRSISNPIKI